MFQNKKNPITTAGWPMGLHFQIAMQLTFKNFPLPPFSFTPNMGKQEKPSTKILSRGIWNF